MEKKSRIEATHFIEVFSDPAVGGGCCSNKLSCISNLQDVLNISYICRFKTIAIFKIKFKKPKIKDWQISREWIEINEINALRAAQLKNREIVEMMKQYAIYHQKEGSISLIESLNSSEEINLKLKK